MNTNLSILPNGSAQTQTNRTFSCKNVSHSLTLPEPTFIADSNQQPVPLPKPAQTKGLFQKFTAPFLAILSALPLVGAGCVPAPSSSSNSGAGVESVQQVGKTSISSNGTTTTRLGNISIGSDGTVYNHIGNTSIGSNGQIYNRIGNTSIGSDGSVQFHFP